MGNKLLKKILSVQTVIVAMAVGIVFNCVQAGRCPGVDLDDMAANAKIAAYINASRSLVLNDTARYAAMLMSRRVKDRATRPEDEQWAIFDMLTGTTDKHLQGEMAKEMVDALGRHPVAPDRYYSVVVQGLPPRQLYELLGNWVKHNPNSTLGNTMWAYIRAYIANSMTDSMVVTTFSDYIAGRTAEDIADEILVSADTLRRRIGVNPALEKVSFDMLVLKKDTAAIEKRASELVGTYSTDPEIGPLLLEAYTSIGREDQSNKLRIKIFEANPSGQMIERLFKSLTTRGDSIDLVDVVARSVRRPDLDIENKIELVISTGDELMAGKPRDEEQSQFILSLADSIYRASVEVADEFADDWEAIRGLANVDNKPWVQYASHPMLTNYALGHPDSLEINSWIVTRLLQTDSIADLGPIIQNLIDREPDQVSYRLLYPVWLNNMGRQEEAAREYSRYDIATIRRAVRKTLEQNGQGAIAEQDTATFDQMVGDVWFELKSYHSQTLYLLGRRKEAADMLEDIIGYARDPKDIAMSYNNIAYYLVEDGRELDRALALADSSLAIRREVTALDTRAWILHKLGRDREAFDDMMEVLAARPQYGTGGEIDLTRIVDYKEMDNQLKPLIQLLQNGNDEEEISNETLRTVLFILCEQIGIDSGSLSEYLTHLFHICRALDDDYGAYSVGVWLRDMDTDDEDYKAWMKQFDDGRPIPVKNE